MNLDRCVLGVGAVGWSSCHCCSEDVKQPDRIACIDWTYRVSFIFRNSVLWSLPFSSWTGTGISPTLIVYTIGNSPGLGRSSQATITLHTHARSLTTPLAMALDGRFLMGHAWMIRLAQDIRISMSRYAVREMILD